MKVSVIIPAKIESDRDLERLRGCINALYCQTYPYADYEVLLIDNNSSVKLDFSNFGNVRIFEERSPGSYAARNRGINEAKGEMLAFTDADCIPSSDWIQSGVNGLQCSDLVAGKIVFLFETRSIVEYIDSLLHLAQERYVSYGYGATANLFVKRAVFDSVGLFNDRFTHLGDREFGQRATKAGHKIIFSPTASISHPARSSLIDLLNKIKNQTIARSKLEKLTIADIYNTLTNGVGALLATVWKDYNLPTIRKKLTFLLTIARIRVTIALVIYRVLQSEKSRIS